MQPSRWMGPALLAGSLLLGARIARGASQGTQARSSANANFTYSDTCVERFAYVQADTFGPSNAGGTYAEISIENHCTGESLFYYGSTSLPPGDPVVTTSFKSAHLAVSIPVLEVNSNTPATVSVDLDWTPVGSFGLSACRNLVAGSFLSRSQDRTSQADVTGTLVVDQGPDLAVGTGVGFMLTETSTFASKP